MFEASQKQFTNKLREHLNAEFGQQNQFHTMGYYEKQHEKKIQEIKGKFHLNFE